MIAALLRLIEQEGAVGAGFFRVLLPLGYASEMEKVTFFSLVSPVEAKLFVIVCSRSRIRAAHASAPRDGGEVPETGARRRPAQPAFSTTCSIAPNSEWPPSSFISMRTVSPKARNGVFGAPSRIVSTVRISAMQE